MKLEIKETALAFIARVVFLWKIFHPPVQIFIHKCQACTYIGNKEVDRYGK